MKYFDVAGNTLTYFSISLECLQYISIIMKPNRYRPQLPQRPSKTALTERTLPASNLQERATLASLLLNFLPTDTYTLTCHHALSLYITSPFQISSRPSIASTVSTASKQQTLQQLLKRYEVNPQHSYLFTAQQNQVAWQDSSHNAQESHKNYISLSRTATEGQLSSHKSQADLSRKQFSEKSDSGCKSSAKWAGKERFGCEQKHNMFTVEQVKQSQQSDLQQSLKENTCSQNKKTHYNFSQLQLHIDNGKISENRGKVPAQGNAKKTSYQTAKQEGCLPSQRNPLCPISNLNKDPNTALVPQAPPTQQGSNRTTLPSEQPKPTTNNSQPGSFATQIRQGLIQNDSYQHSYPASLKLVGVCQIEKQLNNKMSQNDASQISELSSIFSTGHQGLNSRTHISSIKNDIQIIDQECRALPDRNSSERKPESKNKAFSKKENQVYESGVFRQELKVEKLNLHAIAQQRQQKVSDDVIITEKKGCKQPEFLVQYNLRFLQRKNAVTEVMRLSPLRFRAKEQANQANHAAPKLQLRGRAQEETNTS